MQTTFFSKTALGYVILQLCPLNPREAALKKDKTRAFRVCNDQNEFFEQFTQEINNLAKRTANPSQHFRAFIELLKLYPKLAATIKKGIAEIIKKSI